MSEEEEPAVAVDAMAEPESAAVPRDGSDARQGGEPAARAEGAAPVPVPGDWRARARRWAFAVVPLVGVLELLAHAKEVSGTVPESDWRAARAAVAEIAKPTDLVIFAPTWTEPLGREAFGDELAGFDREARPDESRFPRAIEVGIRGKHRRELAGWKTLGERRVGAITITTLENPQPATLLDDLLLHAAPGKMSVTRVDGGQSVECPWVHTATQAGGLGAGPAVPGDRFACPGGNFVGLSMIHALDHSPRRCLFAPPGGGSSVLRVRFTGVTFGDALHGHGGLQNEAERSKTGAPVTLTWKHEDRVIGRLVHQDGEGWKGFELGTPELKGQKGDLVAEITSPSGNRRQYCFEADTR